MASSLLTKTGAIKPAKLPTLKPIGSKPAKDKNSLASVVASNATTRAKMMALGLPPTPMTTSTPSALERIFGVLRTPATGVQSILHNFVDTKRPVNPFEEMGKSFRGEDATNFGNITTDMGWKPASNDVIGKVAKTAVDFAGEVVTDPITYLTGGAQEGIAALAKNAALDVAKGGLTVEVAAAHGLEDVITKFGAMSASAIQTMEPALQDDLYKSIFNTFVKNAGDDTGLKIFSRINPLGAAEHKGITLIPGEVIDKAIPDAVKNVVSNIRHSEAFGNAVGIVSREGQLTSKLGKMHAIANLSNVDKIGRTVAEGSRAADAVAQHMDDITPATGREFIAPAIETALPPEARVELGALRKQIDSNAKAAHDLTRELGITDAVKVAKKAGVEAPLDSVEQIRLARDAYVAKAADAIEAVKRGVAFDATHAKLLTAQESVTGGIARMDDIMHGGMDWQAFGDYMTKVGGQTPEEVAKSVEAAKFFITQQRNHLETQWRAGVPLADRGPWYVPRFKVMTDENGKVVSAAVDAKTIGTAATAVAPGTGLLSDATVRRIPSVDTPSSPLGWMPIDNNSVESALVPPRKLGKLAGADLIVEKGAPSRYIGDGIGSSATNPTRQRVYDTLTDSIANGKAVNTNIADIAPLSEKQVANTVADADFRYSLAKELGQVRRGTKTPTGFSDFKTPDGVVHVMPTEYFNEYARVFKVLDHPEEIKSFISNWDKLNGTWRKFATVMNPGFSLRNMQSNYFLSWAHGYGDLSAWDTAIKIRTGILRDDAILNVGKLHPSGVMTVGELRNEMLKFDVLHAGGSFEAKADDLMNAGDKMWRAIGGGKAGQKLASVGGNFNESVEETGRIAVFLQSARKTGNGLVSGSIVNRVLYDYNPKHLTDAEQGIRKMIPFYVWTRRNLPAMLDILVRDPSRITIIDKMQKSSEALNNGQPINKDILPQYMRDMIPISISMPNGTPMLMNPNWGFQDLQKIQAIVDVGSGKPQEALKEVLATVTPFLKVPLEIGFNQDSFYGTPIEKYPGALTKASAPFQFLDGAFRNQKWWEVIKRQTGTATRQDGTFMINPIFQKVVDSNPFLGNLSKMATTGPQQYGRILSWTLGLKLMPMESEKWQTQMAQQDRVNLMNALQKMKDEGLVPSGK